MDALITALVGTGFINIELAGNWKEREERTCQKKKKNELIQRAKSGEAKAMYHVGIHYHYGLDGFLQDNKVAFQWFKQSHIAGYIPGSYMTAIMLLEGVDVHEDKILGILYLGIAAQGGCDAAAFRLGDALAAGKYGLGIHKGEAIKWLLVATSGDEECRYKMLCPKGKEKAQSLLAKLVHSGASGTGWI